MSPYLDNTDNQNLTSATLTGTTLEIGIESGNPTSVDLVSLVNDADADSTNEIQNLSLTGDNLSLSNSTTTVDLSPYLDNTDNQTIVSIDSGNLITSGSDGGSYLNSTDFRINIKTEIAGNAFPSTNPYVVGGPGNGNISKPDDVYIDTVDIIVFENASGNIYIELEALNETYNGKKITIVEGENENPIIRTYNTASSTPIEYSQFGGGLVELFDTPTSGYLYESVDFIWFMPTATSTGRWIPMR